MPDYSTTNGVTSGLSAILEATSLRLHDCLQGPQGHDAYLIVDPQLRPLEGDSQLLQALEVQAGALSAQATFDPPRLRLPLPRDGCPWLAALDLRSANGSFALRASVEDALLECAPALITQGMGRRIGGWLVADESSQHVQAHFAGLMVQTVVRTGKPAARCYLRLQDPAVLWALWPQLDAAQQRALLGPVTDWWLLDPAGHLVGLHRPASSQGADRANPESPLNLSQTQWDDVFNIGVFNSAICRWLNAALPNADPMTVTPQAMAVVRQKLWAAIRRAAAHGLHDFDDLALFALHALSVHERFDEHPNALAVLARCQSGAEAAESYTAAAESLDEASWAAIRADLLLQSGKA